MIYYIRRSAIDKDQYEWYTEEEGRRYFACIMQTDNMPDSV